MRSKMYKIVIPSLIFGIILNVQAGEDHKKLMTGLFKTYDLMERPVQNENDTLHVSFDVTLMQIIEVNIIQEYLEANMWLTIQWNDFNLKWEPSKYGGIEMLSIPAQKIWKPDILLYNSVHPTFDPSFPTNAVVKSDGNVSFIPPGIFRGTCKIDKTFYPFDVQKCQWKFGSWTFHGHHIKLSLPDGQMNGSADISSFVQNSEWSLIGVPAHVHTIYYACCPEPYISITYTVTLRRLGGQIFAGTSFALIIGAVLTLLSLFLPTNSGQRLTLGVVALIGLLFVGTSINMKLGGPSLLVSYFSTMTLITFMSIISNVFILFLYNRNPTLHKLPNWAQKIFCEILPRFLLLKRLAKDTSHMIGTISGGNTSTGVGSNSQENYEELVTDLQILVQRVSGQETQPVNDWQYFAIVLDRFTLLTYSVCVIIFFIALFSQFA